MPRAVLDLPRLLDLMVGREAKASDWAVANQFSRLQRKIEGAPKQPYLIVTEWGGG